MRERNLIIFHRRVSIFLIHELFLLSSLSLSLSLSLTHTRDIYIYIYIYIYIKQIYVSVQIGFSVAQNKQKTLEF